MVRVADIDESLDFYCTKLGLIETYRYDSEAGRFTNIFLAAPGDAGTSTAKAPLLELTYNWPPEDSSASEEYASGRNFGHIAYEVDDIYAVCQGLLDVGVVICRPPRDGRMAFIKSPDNISIELLQSGDALPTKEPWQSMKNQGTW